jgi:hypothetical protein
MSREQRTPDSDTFFDARGCLIKVGKLHLAESKFTTVVKKAVQFPKLLCMELVT